VKILGILTTAVLTVAAVCAAVVVIESIPDIRRYLKIRSM